MVSPAMRQRAKLALMRIAFIKAGLLIVLLALLPASQLLHILDWGCGLSVTSGENWGDSKVTTNERAPAGRFAGERLLAGSFRDEWDSFRYRDSQPNGSSCEFFFHSHPVKTRGDPAKMCDQDESCVNQFDRVCLTRKDSKAPGAGQSVYDYGKPVMEISRLPSECAEQLSRAKLFGTGSCGRMGKRLPVRVLSDNETEVSANSKIKWKPSTFVIYCAQEGCDYNVFHSIALAYYPVYVAMQKLGLKNLEGIDVEFYESQSTRLMEVKQPVLIAAARERHLAFLQAFRPASIRFLDIEVQSESQHLGCYERVTFVGQSDWLWHCRTDSTEENALLTMFSKFISEALGFSVPPMLPPNNHLLYFKRAPGTARTILNSDDVEAVFPSGYSVYVGPQPENSYRANLKEIVEKARGAAIVFGMHGAGLANAIFAPRNAVVVEVVNCFFRLPLYRNLAVLTGKFYIELVVDVDNACKELAPENLVDFDYHGDHVTVVINDLISALDQAQVVLHRVRSLNRSVAS